jgi:two-component system, NarL family, sensor kinase
MDGEIKYVIIVATIVALVFIAIPVFFIAFYRNRRRHFEREKEQIQRELLHAKIEVQEQTLQHFCRELHDDIGQKLSVARILVNKLENRKTDPHDKEELTGISELLGEAISDMRNAVNTLNPDAINRFGFTGSLTNELKRINKTGMATCSLHITGDNHENFSPQQELLLFRICQEFIQNSLKHASCSLINIHLDYEHQPFTMQLSDNGTGFEINGSEAKGNGLKNMITRAKILGGALKISSSPGEGTAVYLTLPLNKTKP